jgi:osmoprotectant transport system substrate-binding protein
MWRRPTQLVFVGALLCLNACAPPRTHSVVIGAKNFTESVVVGELMAQEIEAEFQAEGHPQRVERRFYLAGSYLCQQALVSGRIDGYVEYSGTALTAILKEPLPKTHDKAEVYTTIARLYEQRYKVRAEPGLGFEDTFAMIMRGDEAERLRVHTISDLKKLQNPMSQNRDMRHPLRLGVGYEFQARPDGLDGLEKAYGIHFETPRVMDLGLLYRALEANQVDVVAGNSTDGPIRVLDLQVLDDDLHYFPPYEAVPLVREDALAEHPEIGRAMSRLAGKVSAGEMQTMNDAVDGRHEDVGEVVRRFRAAKGL